MPYMPFFFLHKKTIDTDLIESRPTENPKKKNKGEPVTLLIIYQTSAHTSDENDLT